MKLHLHHCFAIIGLTFGLLILWLTPPFQSPDETNHYHRSAHITNGNLMGQIKDGNRLGGEIDESLLSYTMYFDSIRKSPDPTFDHKDYSWARELTRSGNQFVDFANVGYYSPTVYIPQCIGQALSSLLQFSPHQSLYLTRFFGLLCWVLIITLSIKVMPVQKILFCFLALLPSSLSLASCISGDTFTSSLCFLWIALLIRTILTDHQVKVKEFTIFCLIIGLITINKLVYFPLAFMILLIPNDRLQYGKLMKTILLLLTLAMLLFWIPCSKSLFIPYSEYSPIFRDSQQLNPPVDPSAQLNWIVSNPWAFTRVALTSYLDSAPATIAHYIGKFGWEKNYLHPLLICILGLAIALLSMSRAENSLRFSTKQLFSFLAIGILMILGLSVSLYLQWSPVGYYRIESLSGRYFIPIIPIILLGLHNVFSINLSWRNFGALTLSLLGLVCLVIELYWRWY